MSKTIAQPGTEASASGSDLATFGQGGKVAAVLREAAGLVERGWNRNGAAGDARGDQTGASDPDACSWCVSGAIWRVVGQVASPLVDEAEGFLCRAVGIRVGDVDDIFNWNDAAERTQAEVVAALRAAALLADGAGYGAASTTDGVRAPRTSQ